MRERTDQTLLRPTPSPPEPCGAHRPGWGPGIGRLRLPCILAIGHEGDHTSEFLESWTGENETVRAAGLARDRLDPFAVREIVTAAADQLDRITPQTTISTGALMTAVQLATWEYYGDYNSVQVGRAITTVLTDIRDVPLTGTRAEHATRLRLHAQAVTL